MLFLISIFDMTWPAKAHQIFNLILTLPTTHTSSYNMVDVYCLIPTNLTGYIVFWTVTEVVQIQLSVLFHIF